MTSSTRQSGTKRNGSSSASISASSLSQSCTNSVQSRLGRRLKSEARKGPCFNFQASFAAWWITSRDAAIGSLARPARSSGVIGDSKAGKAWRTSSGLRCQ